MPQVERADVEAALARIGQHLPGQLGGSRRRLDDVVDLLARRVRVAHLGQRHRGVALDDGEQVVEVVGDAAGENAQALQLLGLQHLVVDAGALLLGAQPPGDVHAAGHHQLECARAIADRRVIDLVSDVARAGHEDAEGLAGEGAAHCRHRRRVVPVEVERVASDDLRRVHPQLAAGDEEQGARRIEGHHEERPLLQHGVELRLGAAGALRLLLQRPAPLHRRGDVGADEEDAVHRARGVAQRVDEQVVVEPRGSVGPVHGQRAHLHLLAALHYL